MAQRKKIAVVVDSCVQEATGKYRVTCTDGKVFSSASAVEAGKAYEIQLTKTAETQLSRGKEVKVTFSGPLVLGKGNVPTTEGSK